MLKICPACAEPKADDEFYIGHRRCKECVKARSAAYRTANKEKTRLAKRLYYAANGQIMRDRAINRYARMRPLILRQTTERHRRYRKEHVGFIIRRRISKRLARVLNGSTPKGWQDQLGYDPALLVHHLESQFEPWMTWENYGTAWHIDHRRPVSSFNLPEQIRECWALSNLRPLSAAENLRKGAKWAASA